MSTQEHEISCYLSEFIQVNLTKYLGGITSIWVSKDGGDGLCGNKALSDQYKEC